MYVVDLCDWKIMCESCAQCPSSSFASNANATMINAPPAYVQCEGTSPKHTQSANATKKTLRLFCVSCELQVTLV